MFGLNWIYGDQECSTSTFCCGEVMEAIISSTGRHSKLAQGQSNPVRAFSEVKGRVTSGSGEVRVEIFADEFNWEVASAL
jgi:hypothetical protein